MTNDAALDLKLRRIISTCLSGMIVLLIMMFLSDYVRLGGEGDFSSLKEDPGMSGIWILAVLVCLNLFAQVSVQATNVKSVKMLLIGFIGLYGLFFLSHQLIHYKSEGFSFDVHVLLDASHHLLAFIALWHGFKWIKIQSD